MMVSWAARVVEIGGPQLGILVGKELGVQQLARYPTGRVAMAEIIKYGCESGYLIPKASFYCLCQEIVSDLALEHQFRWQRSAFKCVQIVAEEFLVMTMTGKLSSSSSIII